MKYKLYYKWDINKSSIEKVDISKWEKNIERQRSWTKKWVKEIYIVEITRQMITQQEIECVWDEEERMQERNWTKGEKMLNWSRYKVASCMPTHHWLFFVEFIVGSIRCVRVCVCVCYIKNSQHKLSHKTNMRYSYDFCSCSSSEPW